MVVLSSPPDQGQITPLSMPRRRTTLVKSHQAPSKSSA